MVVVVVSHPNLPHRPTQPSEYVYSTHSLLFPPRHGALPRPLMFCASHPTSQLVPQVATRTNVTHDILRMKEKLACNRISCRCKCEIHFCFKQAFLGFLNKTCLDQFNLGGSSKCVAKISDLKGPFSPSCHALAVR